MTDLEQLAARVEASKGNDRPLDAEVSVALYSDTGHSDPRDNTYARLTRAYDKCAAGTYWISAFSGLSLRTSPAWTSDPTLKRLAAAALRALAKEKQHDQ